MEEIEKIQTLFLKRVLDVPIDSPNHAVRLETECIQLAYDIFGRALSWLERVLNLEDGRFPKLCLARLNDLAAKQSCEGKYNWVLQLRGFFTVCGSQDLWPGMGPLSLSQIKKKVKCNYFGYLKQKNMSQVQNSQSLQIFPYLFESPSGRSYLSLNLPRYISKLIAQLRLMGSKRGCICSGGFSLVYDPTKPCCICNRGDSESLFHIFISCPMYDDLRSSIYLERLLVIRSIECIS